MAPWRRELLQVASADQAKIAAAHQAALSAAGSQGSLRQSMATKAGPVQLHYQVGNGLVCHLLSTVEDSRKYGCDASSEDGRAIQVF